ncbi:hypothetical protein FHX81_0298 [Saccharothrix saharensis]|uniref:Uncharacterized protein n=1 Tax=Saccharothrix saharensis TaxID=571190 RepID=A0A543J5F0_9PSEU|nr:hypothetical protein FHX81_0298 [Saccharothrix saharensis]
MLSAVAVAGVALYGVVVSGSWWLSVIIGGCGAVAVLVVVGMAVSVEHRCTHWACAEATRRSAATRSVIVDPTTRAWAVIH